MIIKDNQRGLVFCKGNYMKFLKPGKYRKSLLRKEEVVVYNVDEPLNPKDEFITTMLKDEDVQEVLHIVNVSDHELAIHFIDHRFEDVLPPGKYYYWKQEREEDFVLMDTTNPEVTEAFNNSVLKQLDDYAFAYQFDEKTKAYLYYDGVYQRELAPGKHYFWKEPINVEIKTVSVQDNYVGLRGQEILTKDKIALRLNLSANYQVTDPEVILNKYCDYYPMLHSFVQLTLREYIGGVSLDELLHDRKGPGEKLLEMLDQSKSLYGVTFTHVGLVDIILPGDVKEILNTVLIAEKKAQANAISRREEVATTRSLLNTAKLMESNKVLYQLKEMEYIERICDKIGHIELGGGQNVLGQLQQLFGKSMTVSRT